MSGKVIFFLQTLKMLHILNVSSLNDIRDLNDLLLFIKEANNDIVHLA